MYSGSRDQSAIVWNVESYARKNTVAINEVASFVFCLLTGRLYLFRENSQPLVLVLVLILESPRKESSALASGVFTVLWKSTVDWMTEKTSGP